MRLSMRVWDLPVRLFHGVVVLLLVAGYATVRLHRPGLHVRIGEVLLALLVWRVIWGFVGSDTARWRGFLVDPLAALRGPRGPDDSAGHAAAGGVGVLVMLGLLGALIATGFVSATGTLHGWVFWLLLGAIGLHLLLLGLHARRTGERPLRAMISGKKRMPAAMRAPRLAGSGFALLVAACAGGGVLAVLYGLGR